MCHLVSRRRVLFEKIVCPPLLQAIILAAGLPVIRSLIWAPFVDGNLTAPPLAWESRYESIDHREIAGTKTYKLISMRGATETALPFIGVKL